MCLSDVRFLGGVLTCRRSLNCYSLSAILIPPVYHHRGLPTETIKKDATGRTQSTEMLLSDEDGSEKEIPSVRQTSRAPRPKNHPSYTD
ncbi:hypothetical protein EPR50_G00236890 [Perca flavescens]|uniref:Uncharacterized protein n=1 Tax=Perca flavescens TaxID=8167 RepID=A0A484BY93_PERFV|nr:hypothetical protein EPR50_G00236890 [Perca flavescens]